MISEITVKAIILRSKLQHTGHLLTLEETAVIKTFFWWQGSLGSREGEDQRGRSGLRLRRAWICHRSKNLNQSESMRINENQSESIGVNRNRSESIGINRNRSESIGIDWNQSESIGIDLNQSELLGIDLNQSESIRVHQSRSESIIINRNQWESIGIKVDNDSTVAQGNTVGLSRDRWKHEKDALHKSCSC